MINLNFQQLELEHQLDETEAGLKEARKNNNWYPLEHCDWIELLQFPHPPEAVRIVFEAWCVLLQIPPLVTFDIWGNKVSQAFSIS